MLPSLITISRNIPRKNGHKENRIIHLATREFPSTRLQIADRTVPVQPAKRHPPAHLFFPTFPVVCPRSTPSFFFGFDFPKIPVPVHRLLQDAALPCQPARRRARQRPAGLRAQRPPPRQRRAARGAQQHDRPGRRQQRHHRHPGAHPGPEAGRVCLPARDVRSAHERAKHLPMQAAGPPRVPLEVGGRLPQAGGQDLWLANK